MALTEKEVLEAVRPVKDPEIGRSLVEMGMVKDVSVSGGAVKLTVDLTTPGCPLKPQIRDEVEKAVRTLEGVTSVEVAFTATVSASPKAFGRENLIPTVKNVVVVASGKGGVGKSTVAVNLAVALAQTGAKVGLLDADIYGPSVPTMTGLRGKKPGSYDGQRLEPISAYGVKIMSIGFFVEPEQAMVWRGPMLHSAVIQFFRDVNWGEIDYLVLDLPPGTGDVQLTISQQVSVAGAVVVTTPQDVALADAIKAKAMFDRVEIPVLGIVENMSYFICPHCGKETDIFSRYGGSRMAEKLGVPFLGEIPLDTDIREGGDSGVPLVIAKPDSPRSQAFARLAQVVTGRISVANYEAARRQGPFKIVQPNQPRM